MRALARLIERVQAAEVDRGLSAAELLDGLAVAIGTWPRSPSWKVRLAASAVRAM